MKIIAVIGSGYGDEGKGMWVDYRTKTNINPLVIRANGGAQVGHTVVRDGKRHIFSHLGSGTLAGAPTLFTRYSVVNPLLFIKETEGRNSNISYQVLVDMDAPVSTPYDMLLNQATEIRRDKTRHGSCGVGFGVTLEREEQGVHLHFSDLSDRHLHKKIKQVKDWCESQLGEEQNRDTITCNDIYKFFKIPEIIDQFLIDCRAFTLKVKSWDSYKENLQEYDTLIFENGQGLMLDQEYGHFPYVTRSNTGFRNISKFLKHYNLFNEVPVSVDYITRCYTTKHGAGMLPYEREKPTSINVDDPTNVWNAFQHNLRFAPLNLRAMYEACEWDKKSHPPNTQINRIVTCCDQIVGDVWNNPNSKEGDCHVVEYITRGGAPKFLTATSFMNFIRSEFNVTVGSPEGPQLS